MLKEDFVKLGLSDELALACETASKEELKNFIPKSRFDDVNVTKKKLEEDVKTRDKQLEILKSIDADGLKAEVEKLQNENKVNKEKYEAEIKQIQMDSAIEKALVNAKAKNTKAVKALLELEKAEIKDNEVVGLDEQIKKLISSDDSKFLFEVVEKETEGYKPAESSEEGVKAPDPFISGFDLE